MTTSFVLHAAEKCFWIENPKGADSLPPTPARGETGRRGWGVRRQSCLEASFSDHRRDLGHFPVAFADWMVSYIFQISSKKIVKAQVETHGPKCRGESVSQISL